VAVAEARFIRSDMVMGGGREDVVFVIDAGVAAGPLVPELRGGWCRGKVEEAACGRAEGTVRLEDATRRTCSRSAST
jgi:hypothetical protein